MVEGEGREVRAGSSRTLVAVLPFVLVAVASPVFATPPGRASALPSAACESEEATVLGDASGGRLRGTDERDVVLTRGAARVTTGAGDDLVCVTGGAARVAVSTGDGNDRVVVVSGSATEGTLGAGNDAFLGGPAADVVDRGGSPGADQIDTGAGPDVVQTGQSGAANRDVVDLGAGRDQLILLGPDNGSAVLDGGLGLDRLAASYGNGPTPSSALRFDNVAGELSGGADVLARWSGLERFDVATFTTGPVAFLGGTAAEQVWATGGNPVTADLGAGDDRLRIDDVSVLESLDAGDGEDLLAAWAGREPLVASLPEQRLAFADDLTSAPEVIGFSGVEGLELVGPSVQAIGGDGDDLLRVGGCEAGAAGAAGDDRLVRLRSVHLDGACSPTASTTRLVGGDGDDVLLGQAGDDVLVGGPGRDLGLGRGGVDRCRTEIARACELR